MVGARFVCIIIIIIISIIIFLVFLPLSCFCSRELQEALADKTAFLLYPSPDALPLESLPHTTCVRFWLDMDGRNHFASILGWRARP
jgi:hypothetical protein